MKCKADGIKITLTEEEAKDLAKILDIAMNVHDGTGLNTKINDNQYILAGSIIDGINGVK